MAHGMISCCQIKHSSLLNHHTTAQRKANAASTSFGGEEWYEDGLSSFCGNWQSVVAYIEVYLIASAIGSFVGRNLNSHVVCSCLNGILCQIHQYLSEHSLVSIDLSVRGNTEMPCQLGVCLADVIENSAQVYLGHYRLFQFCHLAIVGYELAHVLRRVVDGTDAILYGCPFYVGMIERRASAHVCARDR